MRIKAMLAVVALLVLGAIGHAQSDNDSFTNSTTTVCTAGSPNCNGVQLDGGGSLDFTLTRQTDPHTGEHYFTASMRLADPDGTLTFVQLLPATLEHTEIGTPGCNTDNQFTITVPQTQTKDGNGNSVAVSMTQVLTQKMAGYGRNYGCHYVSLNGTISIQ